MMDRPTAAPATFPFDGHRSMSAVLDDEKRGCFCEMVEIEGDAPGCKFAEGEGYDTEQ